MPITEASAETGYIFSLPSAGSAARRSGYELQLDTRWVDGNGYRPVRLRLSLSGNRVAKRNHTLRVRLTNDWYGQRKTSSSVFVEIPQGEKYGDATLLLPQSSTEWRFEVETTDGGRIVSDLSDAVGGRGIADWTEAAPNFCILDSDAQFGSEFVAVDLTKAQELPDLRSMLHGFLSKEPTSRFGNDKLRESDFDLDRELDDEDIIAFMAKVPTAILIPPPAIPTNWIELSAIDFFVASFEELQTLAEHPRRFEAVRARVAAGATLCVFDIGDQLERLSDLESLLQLRKLPVAEQGSRGDVDRQWQRPKPGDFGNLLKDIPANQRRDGDGTKKQAPPGPFPFCWRVAESGIVVAIRSSDPFPGTREGWVWLFNSLPSEHWMWFKKHGMSLTRENRSYWNLMVPGVGAAPVSSFLFLISVFVILVGPVFYSYLRKRHRLQMIMFVVPCSAGAVTLALMVFAILDDGLQTRCRARSVTVIDQLNRRTVTWARHSYYAGVASSSGFAFPTDTVILPLDHQPRAKRPVRHTSWTYDGKSQLLDEGYLRSRTTAQLLAIRARRTRLQLKVELDSAAGALSVTNELGVDLKMLVVYDAKGEGSSVRDLSAGETKRMTESISDQFEADWNAMIENDAPGLPPGFDVRDLDSMGSLFNTRGFYSDIDTSHSNPRSESSYLERQVSASTSIDTTKTNCYVAIAESAPDLPLGVAAREEASLHIIKGAW